MILFLMSFSYFLFFPFFDSWSSKVVFSPLSLSMFLWWLRNLILYGSFTDKKAVSMCVVLPHIPYIYNCLREKIGSCSLFWREDIYFRFISSFLNENANLYEFKHTTKSSLISVKVLIFFFCSLITCKHVVFSSLLTITHSTSKKRNVKCVPMASFVHLFG